MDDDRIETRAEMKMNDLDRRFQSTAMTQAEYEVQVREIEAWVRHQRLGAF